MEFSYTFEPIVRSNAQKPRVLLLGKTLHDGGEALRNSDWFEIHVSLKSIKRCWNTCLKGANTIEDSGR